MRQAFELAPNDGHVAVRLAVALLAAGQPAEAADALGRAAELEPHYAEVDVLMGDALRRIGDLPGAHAAYTRYLARAPRAATAQRQRAQQWLTAAEGRATP